MEVLVGFAVPLLSQTSHKPKKPRKAQYVANKEHQKVLLNRGKKGEEGESQCKKGRHKHKSLMGT